MRTVVVLFGPPGAGKSTLARQAPGLAVYDRDDEQWTSEAHFRKALEKIGRDPAAQAVVIRTGATRSAREQTIQVVKPTHVYMVMPPKRTCMARVVERDRKTHQELKWITSWFAKYEPGPPPFPGDWQQIVDADALLGQKSREW